MSFFSSFALGVSFVNSSVPFKKILQLLFLFCITTPTGIIIGVFLSSILNGFVESFLAESLKAIAGGTFVYVALIEVIMEEFEDSHGEKKHETTNNDDFEKTEQNLKEEKKTKYIKFLMIILGIILMSIISVQFKHKHSQ